MTECPEENPGPRGFPDLGLAVLKPGRVGPWPSPPPKSLSKFQLRCSSNEEQRGKDGNHLASIMWKEIHSKRKNTFHTHILEAHDFKPMCHDSDVALRQAARECFSPSKLFTQQIPTEVLPLTRLGIKYWDPEMKMCQPDPDPWAGGHVLGDNQV